MGLSVLVLAGQAPLVQVVVEAATVPVGSVFRVEGYAAGHGREASWLVRGGKDLVSDGGQVVLVDALAPVGTPVVYRVVSGGRVLAQSETVVRPWQGRSLLTDAVGGGVVDLLWQGSDGRGVETRATFHTVPGRSTPVVVLDPAVGAGTLSVTARTSGADTTAMLALVTSPGVVALFHNPGRCFQCARGVCDVELVTLLVLTSVSHARSSRVDVAERSWTLKGQVVAVPDPTAVLLASTWDDFDAVDLTWDALDDVGSTWDVFDHTVWQEVGA